MECSTHVLSHTCIHKTCGYEGDEIMLMHAIAPQIECFIPFHFILITANLPLTLAHPTPSPQLHPHVQTVRISKQAERRIRKKRTQKHFEH